MKSIKFNSVLFTAIVVLTSVFTACKKDYEPSRVTFLPEIHIKGDAIFSIVVGDEYEDPGAVAIENGETIDYTISGTIDNTTTGIYILTYLAVNKDGFSSSDKRTVVVLPEAYVPGSADISGDYKRSANGRDSKVTKVVDGLYFMTDGWGSASSGSEPLPINCYLFCTDGENIIMPLYPTVFGGMEGEGTYDGVQMKIQTTLVDQGPASRLNTWVKQ